MLHQGTKDTESQKHIPRIQKLYKLYEHEKWYLMITELLRGGELYTQVANNVKRKRVFCEQETKIIAF